MHNTSITKISVLVFAFLMGCAGCLKAQSEITFVGGNFSNNEGSLSYSVGQVAVRTSIAPAITVVNITEQFSEGVQQALAPQDAVQNEGIQALTVNVAVYPNPTTSYVVLECDQPLGLGYTLFNTNGQTLVQGSCTEQLTLDMNQYAAGNYILEVASKDKSQKNIYKIIKAK